MDAQEIYETVKEGLLEQGRKSWYNQDENMCAYRSEDGCKCGIGMIIPDDLYDPAFEQKGVEALPDEVLDHVMPEDMTRDRGVSFLISIQGVHDHESVEEWGAGMDDVARAFYLDVVPHKEDEE